MKAHLEGLNPSQYEAVTSISGPVLVVAGAGSGKTKTLIHRMMHITSESIEPRHILALTFTNKAAREMYERFHQMRTRTSGGNPFIGTFHSLGVRLLQEEHETIGRPKHFTIFDRDQTKSALREAMKKQGYDPKVLDVNKVLAVLSKKKGARVSFGAFADSISSTSYNRPFLESVSDVWHTYEQILEEQGALDFDDLLLKTALLLEQHPDILKKYQDRWHYIHIDEYQDTNAVQYQIARLLTGSRAHICAVGDADQSIYSWRGADIKNILNFETDFPNAKVIKLETNYRSTKHILRSAQSVIKHNTERIDKDLNTPNEAGEKLFLHTAVSETDEATFVAEKSAELIAQGTEPSNIAVLYRTNFQSRALEEAFLSRHIPYQLLGTRFFERKEVKDILSYIRSALNPQSNSDLARAISTPSRGIGKVSLNKIIEGRETELPQKIRVAVSDFKDILSTIKAKSSVLPPSELIMYVSEHSGIRDALHDLPDEETEERMLNIAELATLASRYDYLPAEEALNAFLVDTALQGDQDSLDEHKEGIRLMTVHASKGLEFDIVFIVGLEEGLFPYTRAEDTSRDAEEERRLFYVALTRARKRVFLTHALMRRVFGTTDMREVSSFIDEIEKECLEYHADSVGGESLDMERKRNTARIFDIEF